MVFIGTFGVRNSDHGRQCPYKKWITAETDHWNHWTMVPTESSQPKIWVPQKAPSFLVLGDMLRPSQSPELPQFLVVDLPL